jgi:hypothetical protein
MVANFSINGHLTAFQYDELINYLIKKRTEQFNVEIGESFVDKTTKLHDETEESWLAKLKDNHRIIEALKLIN